MNYVYIFLGVIILIISLSIIFLILRKMKGSIEIIPEKYNYSRGENVTGNLKLRLKKPVNAGTLIIGLKCEKISRKISAGKSSSEKKQVLFDFNYPLEGKKDFTASEHNYNFSIKIPNSISQELKGITATLVKTAQILSNQNSSVKWYLYSNLECNGVNLFKKVQINVA